MKRILTIILFLFVQTLIAQNTADAFSKSYVNESNKKYQKAIDNMLTIENTNKYSVNYRLGWLYYLNGMYNKSKSYYTRAIAQEKNSVEAKFGLIYPVSAMQNWNEVIQLYTEILIIDKKNSKANYRLAYIYYMRKDWSKTEQYLKKVLKLYPFDYDTNILLGSTYVKSGKIKEAKTVLQTALEYNPNSVDAKAILKAL